MTDIRDYIKDKYALALQKKSTCGCGSSTPVPLSGKKAASTSCCGGPSTEDNGGIPSFGCGFPVESAEIIPGSRILDLGSGAGGDLIRASRKTGTSGKVYGLDMTDKMLEAAKKNIEASGLTNIELLKGYIEDIPMEESMVDLIISNCVINLSPDKGKVLKEAFRVLAPSGRFIVADTILLRDIPEKIRKNLDAWSGCAAGALSKEEYKNLLEAAGFTNIQFDQIHPLLLDAETAQVLFSGVSQDELELLDKTLASAIVRADKPAALPLQENRDYQIRQAGKEDKEAINQILADSDLPLLKEGMEMNYFLIAETQGKLLGVIGSLVRENSALLRSFAVRWEYRNRGVGKALTERILNELKQKQVSPIYILTMTAQSYAEKLGFMAIERKDIPESLLKESGLGDACPCSCACLKME